MTSSKPSPFTSPPVAVDAPKLDKLMRPLSAIQDADAERPVAEPVNPKALPRWTGGPAPKRGSPTMTSSKPSPSTSPAVHTEVPNAFSPDQPKAAAWSLSAVHAATVASPVAEPRKTNARPSSDSPLSNNGAP